jgi:chromosomal replication initiator protein
LWKEACKQVQQVLHKDTYSRWFAIIKPVSYEDNQLTLSVDNDFCQTWIEENYLGLIIDALRTAGASEEIKVKLMVCAPENAGKEKPRFQPQLKAPAKPARGKRSVRANLNAKYTFDEFVVGSCNSFAHAAASAVAKSPGTAYNPLFIYGETALGKTHLMQAVGHEIETTNPEAAVCYTSTEALLNEYIDAIGQEKTVEFRRRYRNVDVLLIDDVHFLVGKKGLQEEFFHTFNTLHNARKQIILCSDRPANELQGLEQRLVSRFEWGLVTSMERPDFETRMAILRNKQAGSKTKLPDELLTFIAENVTSNVRRLEGAVIRAISYASLTGETQTIDTIRTLLRDILEKELQPDISAVSIQKAVADHFDVRMSDMTSKRRQQSVAVPRQVAMFLCRRLTRSSLPEIATEFDKTHATVLHACKTIRGRMDTDSELTARVETIMRQLGRDPIVLMQD